MKALWTVLLLPLLLGSCGDQVPTAEKKSEKAGPLKVYTTFYPTCYFAGRIAGPESGIEVIDPVPPDEDPIWWVPSIETIQAFQEADCILLNGAGYAKWVEKTLLPEERMWDTGEAFKDDLIVIENAVTHSHGTQGSHTHAGTDPHTWLDPIQAMAQCRAIAKALKTIDPDGASRFDANAAALIQDLENLDREFKDLTGRYKGQTILASHPAYNYLARRYGWKVVSFEFDPAELPPADSHERLSTLVFDENTLPFMLFEGEPAPEVKAFFKDTFGIETVLFSPVESPPGPGEDYITVMEQNVIRMAPLFR